MSDAVEMQRADVDGVQLEYELRGSGEPVVLVHWGVSAAWAEPLLDEPALGRHRLLVYHRAGFGGSDRLPGPATMAVHAAHCARLMRRLGVERAHVVGHSSSAAIALQLALDFPEAVHTLALLEPARPVPPTEEQAAFVRDVVGPAVERYRDRDTAGAVETWARGVFGAGHAAPEAILAQAVADADAFFTQELPALQQWSFTRKDAARITQPALVVCGRDTAPTFRERAQLLASWLPDAERFELPEASHLLHLQNPRGMAEALSSFYARHTTAVTASPSP